MKLKAITTGFYKGNRIRPGEEFVFYAGTEEAPIKPPKWAESADAPKQRAARQLDADLKPKAAQAAAKAKAAGTDQS